MIVVTKNKNAKSTYSIMLISLIFTAIYKDLAKWDSGEGEDEEVEEEDELGEKIILTILCAVRKRNESH